jgi:AcrR family transcriptional regulator
MAELAGACGVSKGLLYHYYRDKQHILFDIADSYMDRLLAIVAQVRHRKLPAGLDLECQDLEDRHWIAPVPVLSPRESCNRQLSPK